jgi:taurine dioxygenase
VQLVELEAGFGVEVLDLDPRRVSASDAEGLRRVLDRHHLLVFRGSTLTGDEQVRLCRAFGPIAPESADGYGYVSNRDPRGFLREGALPFHSDLAFTPDPVRALSLHALEVPRSGAPTVFADAVGVLDRLPAPLRAEVERRSIVNAFDFSAPSDRRLRGHAVAPGSPRIELPLVGRHPRTGDAVVWASDLHTVEVVGLSPAAGDALLDELFGHLYGPDNTYRHEWQVGDLLVWDNLALQHHRPDFPATEGRTMQRVCIHDKSLRDLVPNLGELLPAGGYGS